MTVAAVILAAGGGSRFNRDHAGALPGAKLLTLLDGQPLITWALAAPLDAGFDDYITKPVTRVKLKAQLDAAGPAVNK